MSQLISPLLRLFDRLIRPDDGLRKVLKNIGWLSFDKVFRMGVGVIVGVWAARYLGPVDFGSLNYLNAIVAVFMSVALLGMDSVVVKEIINTPEQLRSILSTVFTLRMIVSVIFFVVGGVIFFFDKNFILGIILCLTLFFNPLLTIDLYYQSKVSSKYTVLAQNVAFIIVAIMRVVFILSGASLMAFGIALVVESALSGIFLLFLYTKVSKGRIGLGVDFNIAKDLLQKAWPLIFSSLMIVLYTKTDQIMLGRMLGDYEVGVYSSALRLSEVWYFIPIVICNSFYPSIVQAKKDNEVLYRDKLQKLLTLMVIISVPIAMIFSIFSQPLIDLLYGSLYKDAGMILSIHIWSAVFVFLGVAGSVFFVIEDQNMKAFIRSFVGLLINVALNFVLIPKFLAVGAAVATLIAQIFASYLFDALSSRTRPLFIMKTKAIIGYQIFKVILRRQPA